MARPDLCAQCRKRPVQAQWRPFCSERCKLLDLGRWLEGSYRVPGEPVSPETDEGEEKKET
ncbi:MAG: DNA gyrase inhibitor YacG [Acidobacteria bacterium]|nr:MAG: DNA gyrase inhibitor YacG [Acidobacteriota bacterium]